MNVTLLVSSSQYLRRLLVDIGRRSCNRSLRRIPQSHKPIVRSISQSTSLQGALSSIQTALGDTVIVPDSQQCQQACRERPMHCQVRAQNAVPVFHHTAGSHRFAPGLQQRLRNGLPVRRQACQQLGTARTQDRAALPHPAEQMHGAGPQAVAGLLLSGIECCGKAHQVGQRRLQMGQQLGQLWLQAGRSLLTQLVEQGKQGLQIALSHLAVKTPSSATGASTTTPSSRLNSDDR